MVLCAAVTALVGLVLPSHPASATNTPWKSTAIIAAQTGNGHLTPNQVVADAALPQVLAAAAKGAHLKTSAVNAVFSADYTKSLLGRKSQIQAIGLTATRPSSKLAIVAANAYATGAEQLPQRRGADGLQE